jgi:ATP-dependent Lon protease
LLIHTVGLNPDTLNRREKFITLARLLPMVENNFNFMELGPKGTGKSHVFSELSPYGVLVSGGDVTSARLFSKISGNNEILGLVGYWDVVAWDEYEQQKGKATDAVLVDTMQNYLANKTFNRGKATHEASASMAFVGNTKHTVPYMLKNSHLFESIPTGFIKGAFLDRIHLYNPGWEIKTLRKESFSKGYGLITDYIAAVLHELRSIDFSSLLKEYARFDTSLSERDHLAIRKTFSGFIKLLYPDGNFTQEEAMEIVDFAGESRKRVKDQLYIIDETFRADRPATFEYLRVADARTIKVETLENIENGIVPQPAEPVEEEYDELPDTTEEPTPVRVRRPRIGESSQQAVLMPKLIDVRANQKGVSYKSLFGEYLKGATRFDITDPFVRMPHQVDNLIELIHLIREATDKAEGIIITLNTNNNDDKIPEMIDIFDGLKDDLATYGIDFAYRFDADHDCNIVLNNGWTITLGRGLDIFEKFERFSLASSRQSERRCRAFSIAINNSSVE